MYSVAFCPEQLVVDFVYQLRKELKSVIGSFERENTEAHATVNVFPPMLSVLSAWERHLLECLSFAEPFEICFDSIGHFENTRLNTYTLCLFPASESKVKMQRLMKSVNSKSPKAF